MVEFIYDISRLTTRVTNTTPNGIDWIDSLLADHFLRKAALPLIFGFGGPRLFPSGAVPNPVENLDRHWRRTMASASDNDVPDWLMHALCGDTNVAQQPQSELWALATIRKVRRGAQAFAHYGLRLGEDPRKAPRAAICINAANFPLEWRRHIAWLDERQDVKLVPFIHDLLPLTDPRWFWRREPGLHARRLDLLARRGTAAIVASAEVEHHLRVYMENRGRFDLPIYRARPPVLPLFHEPIAPDPRLVNANYFIACGTIEPRKNHKLLLEVWRRLVEARGPDVPRLLIIGKRGWLSDDIVKEIYDPRLRGSVIEARGLSTFGYRVALRHARALLAPSLAEGFGLPVAEALTAGVPVVASDIAPHREQGGIAAIYLDPAKPDDWRAVVETLAQKQPTVRRGFVAVEPETYFQSLDKFFHQFQ